MSHAASLSGIPRYVFGRGVCGQYPCVAHRCLLYRRPQVTASGVHGRAQHLVGRVLSASDRIVSSIVDDSSRPGSNLSTVLSGLVVRFSLEAQDLLHNAADTVFSEQWLHNILAAKRSQFDIADAVLGDPDM
eukprot:m.162991 g.162991  ORF g.162991 m.162991 type:complete len:132 (-) comp18091_c0_seq6:179-574(-)